MACARRVSRAAKDHQETSAGATLSKSSTPPSHKHPDPSLARLVFTAKLVLAHDVKTHNLLVHRNRKFILEQGDTGWNAPQESQSRTQGRHAPGQPAESYRPRWASLPSVKHCPTRRQQARTEMPWTYRSCRTARYLSHKNLCTSPNLPQDGCARVERHSNTTPRGHGM